MTPKPRDVTTWFALVLFTFSGVPALLYQVVWQRSLFDLLGSNIESVTVVVAAFMLGLGIGSLLGGRLSRSRVDGLVLFAAIELSIAAFGWFSLDLFRAVGDLVHGASPAGTGFFAFALVVLPTMGMGATLPILTRVLVDRTPNVGHSVGRLYFANTLGSASAAFASVAWLLPALGQSGTVRFAVALNLLVGAGALIAWRLGGRKSTSPMCSEKQLAERAPVRSMSWLIGLSFASGFLALSYEIIWVRLLSFGMENRAAVFGTMLSMYLLGLAAGALMASDLCKRFSTNQLGVRRAVAWLFLVGNTATLLFIPAMRSAAIHMILPLSFLLVTAGALLLGTILPLISHLGIRPDNRSGEGLSYIYMANIAGSVAGSLVTGFVLMDVLTMGQLSLLTSSSGALIGLVLVLVFTRRWLYGLAAAVSFVLCAMLLLTASGDIYECLVFKGQQRAGMRFGRIIENRSGVIAVESGGVVYGGGVYDGAFNVDLVHDTNGIFRPYCLSAFHGHPAEVLMIGLSSGSWAQVIAHHPQVERLTVVEINPGYLELIRASPVTGSLLANPKVEIVIDDGRRWLLNHAGRKFDAIVMNTSFHWRAHVTALLSTDFLHLVRRSLKPDGIYMYNTTDSAAVMRTGLLAFSHGLRLMNQLIASDRPLAPDIGRLRNVLRDYAIDGRRILDLSRERDRRALEQLLGDLDQAVGPPDTGLIEFRNEILQRTRHCQLVTDDNMLTEWSSGCGS